MRGWQSGDWKIAALSSDDTKMFMQCRASRPLDPKNTLLLIYSRSGHWVVALASSTPFQSTVGTAQQLTFRFDQSTSWSIAARTANINVVEAVISGMPDLVEALRRHNQLTIETGDGHRGSLSLDGTARLMGELQQCVQTQLAVEKGAAPPPAMPPAQTAGMAPGSPMAQPMGPSPAAPTAQTQAMTAQLELAATRIASNLLLQAKLPGAHLLTPAETPPTLKGLGAAWSSDAGTGSVLVMPPTAGHGPNEIAQALLSGGANACKGEFASGRSTSLVDDTLVTKAFTACSDSQGTRAVRFFIVHREGSWYIVHAVVPPKGIEAAADSPLHDATFQAAVVKAALYQ
jgi:hypothetical protein